MEKHDINKRKYSRFPTCQDAELTALTKFNEAEITVPDNKIGKVDAYNISHDGAFIRTTHEFTLQQHITLKIYLPRNQVHAKCQIIRIDTLTDNVFGVGMKFIEIDESSSNILNDFLEEQLLW